MIGCMDNEQLLNAIQTLLEGMEQRADAKFATIDARLELVNTRLDYMDATVKTRLEKLEKPAA